RLRVREGESNFRQRAFSKAEGVAALRRALLKARDGGNAIASACGKTPARPDLEQEVDKAHQES
ncbi:MAG: hypothetical protein RSE59_05040, partial [Clostridia bacterium]